LLETTLIFVTHGFSIFGRKMFIFSDLRKTIHEIWSFIEAR